MKIFSMLFINIFFLIGLLSLPLNATEVVVTPSSGESFIIDVEPTAPFLEVVEEIQNYLVDSPLIEESNSTNLHENDGIIFSYSVGLPGIFAKKGDQKGPRNYGAPVSSGDKEKISYIILSLAKYNWMQLAKEESSLKKVGKQIENIHPFRFLQCIFTDEKLKAGLFVIRNKNLVWGDYYDGLRKSLNEESDLNNLVQFTPDFANKVGVNVNTILPYVQTRQWSTLIDVLINSIPREGNPDRYDM